MGWEQVDTSPHLELADTAGRLASQAFWGFAIRRGPDDVVLDASVKILGALG